MNRMTRLSCLVFTLAAAIGLAAAEDRWLHVRVEEGGSSPEKVSVNIPLQMVEAVLPLIEAEGFSGGKVHWRHWDHGQHDGFDLRAVLDALNESPDTNFVTVQSDGESVRVAKESGFIIVSVDEDDDKIRVRLPLDVVDALLGDGDEIDLVAGLRRLGDYGGDLVTVTSDDESVRIWIDSSDSGR